MPLRSPTSRWPSPLASRSSPRSCCTARASILSPSPGSPAVSSSSWCSASPGSRAKGPARSVGLSQAVARLAQLLSESQVLRFALHEGQLGDQGAEHLAEALVRNEVLTALSLEGNRAGLK